MDRRSFLTASAALAAGLITPRKAHAGIMVGTDLNVSGYRMPQTPIDGECTIAVNPNSGMPPQGLFAAANYNYSTEAWYSTNGGQMWCPSTGLPATGGDAYAKFDDSGMLYLAYITSSPYCCMLGISMDGGNTFSAHTVAQRHTDQPSVAIGLDYGMTGNAVWLSAEALDSTNQNYPVYLWGAPLSGLPNLVFTEYQVMNSVNGNFGGIAVGPNGEVVASYIQPDGGEGPTTLYIVRLPHGLRDPNMPPPSATRILSTNVGGSVYIPAQQRRHIENKIQLAWDRNYPLSPHGRLYAVYLDRLATHTANPYYISVYVIYSDDAGTTWQGPIRVNDVVLNSRFNAAIAVDQSTGYVCVTWYDCRNSPNNDTAQIYGAISTTNGTSWSSNFAVATLLSDGNNASNHGFGFGDFDTMDAARGYFWCAWADNSNDIIKGSDLTPQSNIQPQFCLGAACITFM